jgi:hypothetical protein
LAILALGGDQRVIEPWPKPLGAPSGYFLIELPATEAGVELKYNVYDFGRRGARVEASKALRLAAAAAFQRTNQDVAFRVVTDYFNLITAQERLEASRQIVKTAQTTQDAAEAQLANGRSTLPDVLNAKAATAQAHYDLEASIGAADTARVVLRESLGVEPSDAIVVEQPTDCLCLPRSPNRRQIWWKRQCNSVLIYGQFPKSCGLPMQALRLRNPNICLLFISGRPRLNKHFGQV